MADFRGWTPVVLAAAILATYAIVARGGFIWDDDAHITANPAVLTWGGIGDFWTSAKANYSPLTMTSFWLQHKLWGLRPAPYHWVVLVFHVAAALMLWRVLGRLAVPGAALGAALWALHPVQAESVAWISQLKNTQSGFFYLAAIFFFCEWARPARLLRWDATYSLALVFAVCAVLSKTSTVMLPVVLGLAAWWLGRRDWREARWLLPFFALSLLAGAWTIWEQKVNSMASGPEWSHSLPERMAMMGRIFWFYVGKLIWPEPLVFIYPRWSPDAGDALAWLLLTAAAGGVVWCLHRARLGQRHWLLAGGCFAVSLFPVCGLFDVFFFRYSFVSDHFQYLASMAPLALAGAGLARLECVIGGWWRTLAVVLVSALGGRAHVQARVYASDVALWHDTAERNPGSWIGRVNAGVQFGALGRHELALTHYEAAVRMRPQFTEVEVNCGNSLIVLGRPAEALPRFQRAIELGRGLVEAHQGMGFALAALGRHAEAVEHYLATLRLQPSHRLARYNLARSLRHSGRHAEAVDLLMKLAAESPGNAAVRLELGLAEIDRRQPQQALVPLAEALRLEPGNLLARCNLVVALSQLGRREEALQQLEVAARLAPDAPEVRQARDVVTRGERLSVP